MTARRVDRVRPAWKWQLGPWPVAGLLALLICVGLVKTVVDYRAVEQVTGEITRLTERKLRGQLQLEVAVGGEVVGHLGVSEKHRLDLPLGTRVVLDIQAGSRQILHYRVLD